MFVPTEVLETLGEAERDLTDLLSTSPKEMGKLLAVLRSVATASGILRGQQMIDEMVSPSTPIHASFCPHCGSLKT